MRTLLCIIMLAALSMSGQTGTKTETTIVNNGKFKSGDLYTPGFFILKNQNVKTEFVFLVGSNNVKGYNLDVCKVSVDANDADMTKKFSNGRSAPVLQLLVSNNIMYVGGKLENEKGVKTTILNSKLEEEGKTVKFTVVGKDFSRSFTLENGQILKQNATTMVMYTDGIGVWKIHKK